MSASWSAGPVVDAVAGHRHDVTPGLQRPRDPQLVLGGDSAEHDAVAVQQLAEHRVVLGQRDALEDDRVVADEADLPGDRRRGGRVIAGHHGELDPRSPSRPDGVRHLRTRRVLETDEAEQLEVALRLLCGRGGLDANRIPPGDGKHPEPPRGHRVELCRGLGDQTARAAGQHGIGSALDQKLPFGEHRLTSTGGVEREPASDLGEFEGRLRPRAAPRRRRRSPLPSGRRPAPSRPRPA